MVIMAANIHLKIVEHAWLSSLINTIIFLLDRQCGGYTSLLALIFPWAPRAELFKNGQKRSYSLSIMPLMGFPTPKVIFISLLTILAITQIAIQIFCKIFFEHLSLQVYICEIWHAWHIFQLIKETPTVFTEFFHCNSPIAINGTQITPVF